MTAKRPPAPESVQDLGRYLAAIDTEVRVGAVHAHSAMVAAMARIQPHKIGGVEIPKEAMLPREVMGPRRHKLEFTLNVTEKRARFGGVCGAPVKVTMEWESMGSPEALALTRVEAEHRLDREILASRLTPAKPKEKNDG